jgi:hypothetical protein
MGMEKKDKQFDDLLRGKLENLELPYQADNWLLFEQKLEDSGLGDIQGGTPIADIKSIDETIFDKLHQYEVPYQPSHWLKMEALLEEVFTLPRSVLRYKLAELALMLLLFAALWQQSPTHEPLGRGAQAFHPSPILSGESQEASGKKSNGPVSPASEAPASKVEDASGVAPSILPAPLEKATAPQQQARRQANGLTPSASKPGALASGLKMTASPLPLPGLNTLLPLRTLPPQQQPSWADLAMMPLTMPLEDRWPGLLASMSHAPAIESAIGRPHKPRPVFRVGMFGSTDYNHIIVPANEEKKIFAAFDRHALGYGGGLSLGMEISNRWELEMAAIYAARQYPVGIVYVEGSLRTGLQGSELRATELNIITLPLHLRYNFLRRSNWRAYALTGAALQVVFQSNFYTAEAPEFDYRPIIAPVEPAPGDENIIIQLRREGVAWFEGGTFKENAYLSGNLGLGLERYVGTRWSVFAQPTLQYSFYYLNGGLGPNKDRINSLSVLFGAKVRLK